MFTRFLPIAMLASGTLYASVNSSPQGALAYSAIDFRGSMPVRRVVEEAESEFFLSTGYTPGDAPPVLLATKQRGSAPSLSVNRLEGGSPEILLVLPKDPDDPQVPQFLATALLLRQYYGKNAPVPGSCVPRYPDWMTRGLGGIITKIPTNDTEFQPVGELESFLTERVPDSGCVSLLRNYDTLASVLVRSGLNDDRGRKAFREWIGCCDPAVPFRHPSPWVEGWDMRSVERRWNLGLRSSKRDERLPGMIQSAPATLREFRSLMEEGRSGNESLADVARQRGGEFLLQKLSQRLMALRLHANPLVVPVMERAMKLVVTANRQSPRSIRREEEQLRQDCLSLGNRSREIVYYLDWCEAAKVDTPSGFFDGYLATPYSIKGKGPIGRHLDAVESRGW